MEKFQISVKNWNNLWRFIDIYAVFVLNLCGKKSLWRKNDKYEVWYWVNEGLLCLYILKKINGDVNQPTDRVNIEQSAFFES